MRGLELQGGCPLSGQAGSGMGMRHSGSISDIALLMICEKGLLQQTKELGILVYVRLGDILVAVRDPQAGPKVMEALTKAAAALYRIELESFGLLAVPMLDLLVLKHEASSGVQMAWKPFVKPTARHVPLRVMSAQSMSCHRSWPRAEIQRMFSRSCFEHHFQEAKSAKLTRFGWFFLPE